MSSHSKAAAKFIADAPRTAWHDKALFAIFVKYEFWINLLTELRRRSIRSYIVSAIFRRNSIFSMSFGTLYASSLPCRYS